MWHYIFVVLLVLVFPVIQALATTEENDPELAKKNSMKRILRKNGLLGRRDK
jgi:hypothetical protein